MTLRINMYFISSASVILLKCLVAPHEKERIEQHPPCVSLRRRQITSALTLYLRFPRSSLRLLVAG
jgi:hypothetical protein